MTEIRKLKLKQMQDALITQQQLLQEQQRMLESLGAAFARMVELVEIHDAKIEIVGAIVKVCKEEREDRRIVLAN